MNSKQATQYFLIPNFIGTKKGEITLIWGKYDCQETTKAVLSENDTHDFELGFLIAYYKRVHKDWKPEVLRNKIIELFDKLPLETEIEKMSMEELKKILPKSWTDKNEVIFLKHYLRTVFYDNCLLDFENAKRFLKYIIKRSEQATIPIPENFITKTEKI